MTQPIFMPQPRTEPNFPMPQGACNTHVHVVGALNRYPQAPDRAYTYAPALVVDLLQMLDKLHLDRVVLVSPSVYKTNNDFMVDALHELGDRARGIAVIGPDIADSELQRLDQAGTRGCRIIPRSADEIGLIRAIAERIRPLGWHLQMFIPPKMLLAMKSELIKLRVPLVLDHFAGALAKDGVAQPGFSNVLELLRDGLAWVKISGLHRSSHAGPDYADVQPLIDALLKAAPNRLVWGNDWPHPMVGSPGMGATTPDQFVPWGDVDDGYELNLMAKFIPDSAIRDRILSQNAAQLYGF